MKRYIFNILLVISLFSLSGCIVNDIPYPKMLGSILSFNVEGQLEEEEINADKNFVLVKISDTIDITNVKVLKFQVSEGAVVYPSIPSNMDLTKSQTFILKTYPGQEYIWKISASQTIERYFNALDSADDPIIDPKNRSVLLKMPKTYDLTNINIESACLGSSKSQISPNPVDIKDYFTTKTFDVSDYGRTEKWTVTAIQVESVPLKVTTLDSDAYAKRAILLAQTNKSVEEAGFKYKLADAGEWIDVPSENIKIDDKSISAEISGLESSKEYIYYAFSSDKSGEEVHFTTEAAAQLPNMNYDSWIKDDKNWYVNPTSDPSSADYFWDTANAGANILGTANPTKPEETIVAVSGEGKKAGKLETISVVGILAAGNIYSGQYIKTQGVNAILDWGRPFSSRPTALEGYYMYKPVAIDKVKSPYEDMKGKMDKCQIFVALMDWDEEHGPHRINSGEKNYIDFATDPHVVGFGEIVTSESMSDYEKFRIDIKYRNNKKATYVILISCASYYGNYFTGGVGSTLYVDEFSFVY